MWLVSKKDLLFDDFILRRKTQTGGAEEKLNRKRAGWDHHSGKS